MANETSPKRPFFSERSLDQLTQIALGEDSSAEDALEAGLEFVWRLGHEPFDLLRFFDLEQILIKYSGEVLESPGLLVHLHRCQGDGEGELPTFEGERRGQENEIPNIARVVKSLIRLLWGRGPNTASRALATKLLTGSLADVEDAELCNWREDLRAEAIRKHHEVIDRVEQLLTGALKDCGSDLYSAVTVLLDTDTPLLALDNVEEHIMALKSFDHFDKPGLRFGWRPLLYNAAALGFLFDENTAYGAFPRDQVSIALQLSMAAMHKSDREIQYAIDELDDFISFLAASEFSGSSWRALFAGRAIPFANSEDFKDSPFNFQRTLWRVLAQSEPPTETTQRSDFNANEMMQAQLDRVLWLSRYLPAKSRPTTMFEIAKTVEERIFLNTAQIGYRDEGLEARLDRLFSSQSVWSRLLKTGPVVQIDGKHKVSIALALVGVVVDTEGVDVDDIKTRLADPIFETGWADKHDICVFLLTNPRWKEFTRIVASTPSLKKSGARGSALLDPGIARDLTAARWVMYALTEDNSTEIEEALEVIEESREDDLRPLLSPALQTKPNYLPASLQRFIRSDLPERSASTYRSLFRPIIEDQLDDTDLQAILEFTGLPPDTDRYLIVAEFLNGVQAAIASHLRGSASFPELLTCLVPAQSLIVRLLRTRRGQHKLKITDEEVMELLHVEHKDLDISTLHRLTAVGKEANVKVPQGIAQQAEVVGRAIKQSHDLHLASLTSDPQTDSPIVDATNTARLQALAIVKRKLKKARSKWDNKTGNPSGQALAHHKNQITDLESAQLVLQGETASEEDAYLMMLYFIANPAVSPSFEVLAPLLLLPNWDANDALELGPLRERIEEEITFDVMLEVKELFSPKTLAQLWQTDTSAKGFKLQKIGHWIKNTQRSRVAATPKPPVPVEIAYSNSPLVMNLAGPMGDACFSKNAVLPDNSIVGTFLIDNKIAGNFLVFRGKRDVATRPEEEFLVIQGINPLEKTLRKVTPESLLEAICDSLRQVFPGYRLAMIVDPIVNSSTSNRAEIHNIVKQTLIRRRGLEFDLDGLAAIDFYEIFNPDESKIVELRNNDFTWTQGAPAVFDRSQEIRGAVRQ